MKPFQTVAILALSVSLLTSYLINIPSTFEEKSLNSVLPSSTTIWEEYPKLQPRLYLYPDAYVYVTTFGNYSMLKPETFRMQFVYRDGTKMIDESLFWILASGGELSIAKVEYVDVLFANDTDFRVRYSLVTKKTQVVVGNLTVRFKFYENEKPKISALFEKFGVWTEKALGDFNIFWALLPDVKFKYWKYDQTSAHDCTNYIGKTKVKTDTKIELGVSSDPETWMLWSLSLWEDYGDADVYVGSVLEGWGRNGILVEFETNDYDIDPSTVAQSSTVYATRYAYQRKTISANGRHWVFYSNGTYLKCSSSTDGVTWIDSGWERSGTGTSFSVDYDGTYLHYAYSIGSAGSSLYYRRGFPNSDGTITWTTPDEEIAEPGHDWFRYVHPSISVDSNNYPYIAFYYPAFDVAEKIWIDAVGWTKSQWNNGSWLTESGYPMGSSSAPWKSAFIVSRADSKMTVFYNSGVGGRISGSSYNGTDWLGEFTVAPAGSIEKPETFSGVGIGNDWHIVWLEYTTYNIKHKKRGLATVTVQSGQGEYASPTIAKDSTAWGNDVYSFWINFANMRIYFKRYYTSTDTWGDLRTFATLAASPVEHSVNSFYSMGNDTIGAVWLEGTAAPYSIKYDFIYFPHLCEGCQFCYPYWECNCCQTCKRNDPPDTCEIFERCKPETMPCCPGPCPGFLWCG